MALQKEYQSSYGVNFPQSYHRILVVYINRGVHNDDSLMVRIETWITAQARQDLVAPIISRDFSLPILKDVVLENTLLGEIYNRLKELDEFAESKDV